MAKRSKETLVAAQKINRAKPCINQSRGCTRKRAGGYGKRCHECSVYERETGLQGPPLMKRQAKGMSNNTINRVKYGAHFAEAEEMIARFRNTQPVLVALRWLKQWIELAEQSYEYNSRKRNHKYKLIVPARQGLIRIAIHESVDREVMLIHLLAAHYWRMKNPRHFETESTYERNRHKMMTFYGSALLHCTPFDKDHPTKRAKASEITEAGEYLTSAQHGLMGFFMTMVQLREQFRQLQDESQALMRCGIGSFTQEDSKLIIKHREAVLALINQLEKGD